MTQNSSAPRFHRDDLYFHRRLTDTLVFEESADSQQASAVRGARRIAAVVRTEDAVDGLYEVAREVVRSSRAFLDQMQVRSALAVVLYVCTCWQVPPPRHAQRGPSQVIRGEGENFFSLADLAFGLRCPPCARFCYAHRAFHGRDCHFPCSRSQSSPCARRPRPSPPARLAESCPTRTPRRSPRGSRRRWRAPHPWR